MNTDKELNYRLFVQMEEEFVRTDIKSEFSRYDAIKNGNTELVRENFKNIRAHFYEGKGVLSDDKLRNTVYHFAIGTGIIARLCIDGGMKHNIAYTLSDIYIRRADTCKTPEEVIDLLGVMQLDFAQRMKDIRVNNVSLHVRRAVEYIYQNLHEALTLRKVADYLHLNSSYLSKLFSKEMNETVKAFILKAKITTAQNILIFSDYPISAITQSLGFSSQSAFNAAFKKLTGMTPLRYRNMYSDEHSLAELV
ncbi:MAG: helix-turn-helix transcriptional regulator [Oscillospiraceae bacterium]|nr:helix-turn-helix transcriptional regulator [Oscillospiraceae bacterium]